MHPKELTKQVFKQMLVNEVHRSLIHNSPNVETSQVFISRCIDKQKVAYSHNGVLFSTKSMVHVLIQMNVEYVMFRERSQTQKACVI